jgi:pilus assembly protein CpaB
VMAAIIAGGSTYLISRRLRPTSAGPGLIQIVAAAKDLPAGIPLSAQDLTTIGWPDNVPLAGSINKIEAAVGRPLLISVSAKQPLLDRDLAAAGSGFGLSGKIPPGMRATAVRSNEIVGVAGFLFPGSHVDVVATYSMASGSSASGTATQTVLQNVEVLTTGTATEPDPSGKAQTVSVVTLLLTPEDSQKMLLAAAQGSIQFVLRSGVDQQKVDLAPTRIEQLVSSGAPPPPPVVVSARPAAPRPAPQARVEPAPPPPVETPKPPDFHVIEVIQGSQRTTQKF